KLETAPDAEGGSRATEYAWDGRDMLREVRLPDGRRVRFAYDAFGRRTRKEVLAADGTQERAVDYLWDGEALAADVDTAGLARCFVHEPGTLIPLLQQEKDEVFFYVTDHHGTVK